MFEFVYVNTIRLSFRFIEITKSQIVNLERDVKLSQKFVYFRSIYTRMRKS